MLRRKDYRIVHLQQLLNKFNAICKNVRVNVIVRIIGYYALQILIPDTYFEIEIKNLEFRHGERIGLKLNAKFKNI